MKGEARVQRLRWMCRRGMKELDVLLERFLSENQSRLAAGDWPEFEEFLQIEDDILWDVLRGESRLPSPEYAGLAKAITQKPGG